MADIKNGFQRFKDLVEVTHPLHLIEKDDVLGLQDCQVVRVYFKEGVSEEEVKYTMNFLKNLSCIKEVIEVKRR